MGSSLTGHHLFHTLPILAVLPSTPGVCGACLQVFYLLPKAYPSSFGLKHRNLLVNKKALKIWVSIVVIVKTVVQPVQLKTSPHRPLMTSMIPFSKSTNYKLKEILPPGTFSDLWRYFGLSYPRVERCYWYILGIYWVKDAIKHPKVHRTAPP